MLKISIGSDHGGYEAKVEIVKYLKSKGYEVLDVGTNSKDSCHYTIFANEVAENVSKNISDVGVLICTSGEGVSIAANKFTGVRCGIAYNDEVAALIKQHNNCNIIAFGAKFMSVEDMKRRIDIFLNSEFLGGRHLERINLMKK